MDFCRNIKVPFLSGIDLVPFINVILLSAVFFLFVFMFASSASLHVKLPRAVTSEMAGHAGLTIMVTSENILYVNGRVTTLQELKKVLAHDKEAVRAVFIKADRRASVGRVVDIWNLGRDLGIEQINIATDQQE